MADFNKILTPGDYENGIINVVVEIHRCLSFMLRSKVVEELLIVEPGEFRKSQVGS